MNEWILKKFSLLFVFSVCKTSPKKLLIIIFSVWCAPCKKIQPKYEALASSLLDNEKKKNAGTTTTTFWTVDVDEMDMVASKYNISMMPTFVIAQGDQVVGKLSGSNEAELETFMKEHLA
jgi:thioredoxin 1